MSFFRKLLGRESATEITARADAAANEGRYGIAKLEYEKAADRAESDAEKATLRARVVAMRNAIATSRLDEADKLVALGVDAEALAEARGALDVADDEELLARARLTIARIRTNSARTDAGTTRSMTRDEIVAEITATYSDEQADEYAAYGEPAVAASVLLANGTFAEARAAFEAVLAGAKSPRWLHRDVARARWADGDLEGADAAFVSFFETVTDEEHDRALFEARLDRARLFEDRQMLEEAIEAAGDALDHAGDQPRAFVVVAQFLRAKGHPTEAREILEASLSMPGSESDPAVQIELAMCESAEGSHAEALDRLDRVALGLRQMGQESPREVEAARAQLLERVGRLENAAELFKRLAVTHADTFGFEAALESARLHHRVGSTDEARHLLERASLLVGASETHRALLAERRAALDAPPKAETDSPLDAS